MGTWLRNVSVYNIAEGHEDFHAETRAENERATLHDMTEDEKRVYETVQFNLRRNPGRREAAACEAVGIAPKVYFAAKRKAEADHHQAFGERGFSHADLIRPNCPLVGGKPKARGTSPKQDPSAEGDRAREGYFRARERRRLETLDPSKTKTCRKCSVEKSIVEFHRHPTMADGMTNQCKSCTAERHKKNQEARRRAARDERTAS